MPIFTNALRDWESERFSQTLKSEILGLPSGVLPLDKGTTHGGYVDDSNLAVIVQGASDDGAMIRARLGVFFTEIVVNCGCGVDPMPTNAYCELQVTIDKQSAAAEFSLIPS